MFVLVRIQDTVRCKSEDLNLSQAVVVKDSLQAKYANRVLENQGLCIAVYDFIIMGNVLHASDGGAHIRVEFRLIMFRPTPGEIIVGKLRQCDSTGLYISVDFFDHIFLPASRMQSATHWNDKEQLWVWNYEGHELFMDLDEPIRFRVEDLQFADQAEKEPLPSTALPDKPEEEVPEVAGGAKASAVATGISIADFKPPMRVVATIQEDGLGLLSWWT